MDLILNKLESIEIHFNKLQNRINCLEEKMNTSNTNKNSGHFNKDRSIFWNNNNNKRHSVNTQLNKDISNYN